MIELKAKTKKCKKCKAVKPIDLFCKCRNTQDGLQIWCKECKNKNRQEWKKLNRNKDLNYHPDYIKKERDKACLYQASYNKKFPERGKAHGTVNRKIGNGSIERQPCEICGCEMVDAHHDDYSKPLAIRWLCKSHHTQLHRRMNEAKAN